MQSPDERPPEQTRGHFTEQGLGFSRVEGRVRLFLRAVRNAGGSNGLLPHPLHKVGAAMQKIKYYPLIDRDSTGMVKTPMFFSDDEDTVRQSHEMYLQEIVPQYY